MLRTRPWAHGGEQDVQLLFVKHTHVYGLLGTNEFILHECHEENQSLGLDWCWLVQSVYGSASGELIFVGVTRHEIPQVQGRALQPESMVNVVLCVSHRPAYIVSEGDFSLTL